MMAPMTAPINAAPASLCALAGLMFPVMSQSAVKVIEPNRNMAEYPLITSANGTPLVFFRIW